MKRITLSLLLPALFFCAYGQSAEQLMPGVLSPDQLKQIIQLHPEMKPQVFTITSDKDTSAITLPLFSKKTGYTFRIGTDVFKIISSASYPEFRVSYIYLDGSVLSMSTIDSLRNTIRLFYKEGEPFYSLARWHTMDINASGDNGWFREKTLMPEFEAAVRQHKKGDLFTVDIPENKWYYVVLKTFNDRVTQELTMLKLSDPKK